MKKLVAGAIGLSLLSSAVMAHDFFPNNEARIGIQGAIATGGALGIGLTRYTLDNEVGLTLSASKNSARNSTQLVVPVIFAGLRKALTNHTSFAYGLDFVNKFGRIAGASVQRNYQVGPYISIEQMLSRNVMLVGWIEPYSYEYAKVGGAVTTTHRLFGEGGMGINYLF